MPGDGREVRVVHQGIQTRASRAAEWNPPHSSDPTWPCVRCGVDIVLARSPRRVVLAGTAGVEPAFRPGWSRAA
jgi:hypothetical protein